MFRTDFIRHRKDKTMIKDEEYLGFLKTLAYVYRPGLKDGTLRNGPSMEMFEHWNMLSDLVEQ